MPCSSPALSADSASAVPRCLAPVYIAELAPAQWRGRLVGMFQVNIVVGILLAYFSNFVIAELHTGAMQWRWQLGIAAIPAILFLIMLFGIPRSSRWLVTQDRIDEARQVLQMMGTPKLRGGVERRSSPRSISSAPAAPNRSSPGNTAGRSFSPQRSECFNQLSGINAILYYLN